MIIIMAANSKKRSQETKENNNNNKKSMRYNILYRYTDRAFYKGRVLQPILLCIHRPT